SHNPMDTKVEDDPLDLRASEFKSALDAQPDPQPEESTQPDFEIKNIDWVACKDFTLSVGKKQIEEYMCTWEMNPKWLFSVQFLQERELEYEKQFLYRALWSIPTSRRPIPAHTASVYFTISISKIKPQTNPVQVRFQLEFSKTTHVPGKTIFREKWLNDSIENKSLLMETITF
ncbi:A-kinase anchor protein 14, partial [Silurus meridionalis]